MHIQQVHLITYKKLTQSLLNHNSQSLLNHNLQSLFNHNSLTPKQTKGQQRNFKCVERSYESRNTKKKKYLFFKIFILHFFL